MIGQLRGVLREKTPPEILLDVGGVGYEVAMPMTCFYELADIGQEIVIFTHFIVREDAQLLYGFNHKNERALFRELIKVNGVGPKLALAILSGMSAQQFMTTVERSDINLLVKLPGVGKKTAERLLVEMKDRLHRLVENSVEDFSLTANSPSSAYSQVNVEEEAISALVSLGYKPQEASKMISRVNKAGADCETLIRDALKLIL